MEQNQDFDCKACTCVEIGSLIKEDDVTLIVDLAGVDAEERFEALKASALQIGSGNCQISSEIVELEGVSTLRAAFVFDCTAEKLIFQMKNS